MPRPLRRDPETREPVPTSIFTVRLPDTLILQLRVLYADPRSGRGRYRSFGRMVERALTDWLDTQKVAKT